MSVCLCAQGKEGFWIIDYNLIECHDCEGTQAAVIQQNQSHLAAAIWK